MNKLSLFSGIAGIDLAAKWAGMKTRAFCESEPFPQKVLRKHWPDIPIYDDVRTLTRARLEEDGIITASRAIDIVSAGYPCQPYSVAGKREGKEDDRALWPEVARIISEIRPRWFVGENVAGHITLGLDGVLDDLDNLDYTSQPFVIPAAAVGANHKRDRIFIISHSNSKRLQGGAYERSGSEMWKRIEQQFSRLLPASPQPKVSTADFSREGYGLSRKLDADRIKALGNAVYPYQIFPILAAIKAIDDYMGREGRA
ncbi:DNA cytosine methyltransferase [Paenibacillus alvei]|uniref:DNA cytosine methyltransferase n=1 Tax=Paenibacillus alvei TaxID=44250 RepID=UPI0013D92A55|nr:DNA cytosine methyltransferase [Paenibacillus alvei]MCY9707398.1 DNA cytosine methyltransferase [Paenibacillus alvei]NEZ44932.1 DNA (cytosine-5-)-methyltransferase [Paenibacillus alvei]